MQFPKFPDWLLYASVATAILLVAGARREDASAPPPPPPVPGEADTPLDPALPFDPAQVINLKGGASIGAAFSVAQRGVWLTSAEAVRRCPQVVVTVAEGRGVRARLLFTEESGVAVLTTRGGSRPLPLRRDQALLSGQRGFIPGFPAGPGEASTRFLAADDDALVWAETGRTEGLTRGRANFAGAPLLDVRGRVVGVVLTNARRRGTFQSTKPKDVAHAVSRAQAGPVSGAEQPIDTDNYPRVADQLRRDLSVVELRCIGRPM